jgi:hypothetical protein
MLKKWRSVETLMVGQHMDSHLHVNNKYGGTR